MSMAKRAVKHPSKAAARQNRIGYGFIMPWLIGLFVFTLIPMLFSLVLSFCKWDIVKGLSTIEFIGFQNFIKIFNDKKFYKALEVTFKFCLISIPMYQICSLLVAMLLNMRIKFMRTFRLIFFLPSIIPTIATSMIWAQILGKDGLINQGLRVFGIQGPAWLNDPKTALYGLILMGLWGIGNTIIIYLSGLQGVGEELYEASSIDGANAFQRFFKITLPMISPTIFFNVVMAVISSFQYFTQAFVMTEGGPLIYLGADKYTLALGRSFFKGLYTSKWNLLMAATVLVLLPVLIIFFVAQDYIIDGISISSGTKG